MDLHKGVDCAIGTCTAIWGVQIGSQWLTALGGALVVWRAVQAFVLEPMGIFWPRPRRRRRGF